MGFIQYFFYLGFNWNWRIAWVIIRQEINGEKKYGINTTGADELKKLKAKGIDIAHATIYMPVSYSLLENIFLQLAGSATKHFIDIGCGKGRALCVAAFNGYTKVTGVDFSESLCKDALLNLEITQTQIPSLNYTVLTKDALDFDIPADADCIFLFNPFDEIIMHAVVTKIVESKKKNGEEINVVYVNPLYKDLFFKEGFNEIYYSKTLKYFEVSILNFRY